MAVNEIGLSPQLMGADARMSVGPSENHFPIQGTLPERIATVINSRYDLATSAARTRFELFSRFDRIIKMISKKKAYEWKANVYLPYALQAVEMGAAMKFLMLMRTRPRVMVKPRRAAPQEIADHREGLLDWHFEGDTDLVDLLPDMLRSTERYGKAVALVVPDWESRTLRYRAANPIPTIYGPLARMSWKTQTDRAYRIIVENQDLTTLRPQPGYRRINGKGGMQWFIREYWKTYDELEQMEAEGNWGPAIGGEPVAKIRDTSTPETNEWRFRRMLLQHQDDGGMERDKFDRMIHIIEYAGAVPRELVDPVLGQMEQSAGLNPRQRVMFLANRKVVGGNQAIPWDHGFKPYIEMDCIPDLHGFWATGKVEPIEHMVYAGNEILNMRIDNVKAAINSLIGIDGTRMPPGWKRRLVSQPFGVHETNGNPQEIIQRLQTGDVTQSSYQEQQQLYGLIQEATSLNETVIGAPGGSVRTLGEHQMKAEASSRRLSFELARQANQLFSATRERPGLCHFILMLDRQYMPLPQYINLVRPGMPDSMGELAIGPADLALDLEDFSYVPSGSVETVENQQRRIEMTQLLATLQPYMELAIAGGLDIMDLLKQTMRSYNLDTSRLFPRFPTGQMAAVMQAGQQMSQRREEEGEGGRPGGGGGGGIVPFRGRGLEGGGQRPEQRAAPGNRPTPPWERSAGNGGRYAPGNRPGE